MSKPLRDEINDAIVRYLENKLQTGEPVNTAAMAYEMAQCIVDMIMKQHSQNQALLLAMTILSLGDGYLRNRDLLKIEEPGN
ncbi:MAG: hypothetical protein ACLP19_28690 [Xanthobacteraceae bacterium]